MRGRIGVMSVSREPRGAEGRAARMAVEVRRDPERFRGADSSDRRAEALNSLYKAELIRNQGPWEDIDAARTRHRRVGPLVRAPPGHTPPSGLTRDTLVPWGL